MNPENRKPGNHGRAVAWLLYLLLLALTICFASSMVVYLVFERLVFGLLPVAPAGQIAILLAVVLGHTLTLWRRLPAALLEPARRVAAGLGMVIYLERIPLAEPITRDDFVLFSESNTRFLAEVAPEDKQQFEDMMAGNNFAEIGQVTNNGKLEVYGRRGHRVLAATLAELKEAWQQPLRW